MSSKLSNAHGEIGELRKMLKAANQKIASQARKIDKLSSENKVFRKFYVRNLADTSENHTREID